MDKIQLIVIDLDGTLLDSQKKISAKNISAIQKAAAKDVKIAIASGRLYPDIVQIFNQDLAVSGYKICLNGSYILNEENQVVSKVRIEKQKLMKIFEIAYINDVSLFCNGLIHSINFARKDAEELVLNGRTTWVKNIVEFNQKLVETDINIYKFGIHSTNMEHLQQAAEAMRLEGLSLVQTEKYFFEGMNQGINKYEGIRQVAQSLDIPVENVMTIGDQENDIEMIQGVGYGIAMGNAIPAVQSAAAYQTETNDQNGVAQIIHDLVLKEDEA